MLIHVFKFLDINKQDWRSNMYDAVDLDVYVYVIVEISGII